LAIQLGSVSWPQKRVPMDATHGLTVLVALLALLGVIYAAWPIWRALFPMEIGLNEPWNAFYAELARQGGVLYPSAGALSANDYPPLSFYFIGMLTALTDGDAIYLGRFLSFVAVAIVALCTAACVRLFAGTRLAATVAAFWFLATVFRFFDDYVGMNDPHLPALAIMTAALVWALHLQAHNRAVEPAILLMVLAGFYKHSLIATPVTALLWIGLNNWRLGLRAALTGTIAVVTGFAICGLLYGGAFFQQLMPLRVYSIGASLASIGQLQWIAPALAIWAVWAWNDRNSSAARFSGIYVAAWLACLFSAKAQGRRRGQRAVRTPHRDRDRPRFRVEPQLRFSNPAPMGHASRIGLCLLILIARLLLSSRLEAYLVLASSDYRKQFADNGEVTAREIERVRSLPGLVHCSVMTVCMRAGKGVMLEPFTLQQRVETGLLAKDALNAQIEAASVRRIEVDPRANAEVLQRRL